MFLLQSNLAKLVSMLLTKPLKAMMMRVKDGFIEFDFQLNSSQPDAQ